MPTPQKEAIVAEITQKLNEAKSIFLTDFKGLNVHQINDCDGHLRMHLCNIELLKIL